MVSLQDAAKGVAGAVGASPAIILQGLNSPPVGQAPGSKRKVVLHQEHGEQHLPHHHSPLEIELGLVVAVVLLHVLALCFFGYLLMRSKGKDRKRTISASGRRTTGDQPNFLSPSRRGKTAGGASSSGGWRTPGEILSTWKQAQDKAQKEKLGKV